MASQAPYARGVAQTLAGVIEVGAKPRGATSRRTGRARTAENHPRVRLRKKRPELWCVFSRISLQERIWRAPRAQLPAAFCDSGQAQRARQYPRLQQVLCDFGAEHSFVQTTGADALSGPSVTDERAPARSAIRYLSNRLRSDRVGTQTLPARPSQTSRKPGWRKTPTPSLNSA